MILLNQKWHVTCNFDCLIEAEGLLEVTVTYNVQCGNV